MDKVALVTGSGHRLGKAIALRLARAGYAIMVHYGGSEDRARATADEIRMLGVEVDFQQADLAITEDIGSLFAALADRFGRLDALVNSAAVFDKKAFEDVTVDDWERSMQINLRAPFLCMQQAARLMRSVSRSADETASIVNIVDLSGVYAWRDYIQHGVSKAGLLHLTRIAARALAPDIRVNAIAPGPVMPPPGVDEDSEAWAAYGEAMPLARPGKSENVAEGVLHLIENDYVTGTLINVDGGEHLVGPINHL